MSALRAEAKSEPMMAVMRKMEEPEEIFLGPGPVSHLNQSSHYLLTNPPSGLPWHLLSTILRRLQAAPLWPPLEGAADEGGWRSVKRRLRRLAHITCFVSLPPGPGPAPPSGSIGALLATTRTTIRLNRRAAALSLASLVSPASFISLHPSI